MVYGIFMLGSRLLEEKELVEVMKTRQCAYLDRILMYADGSFGTEKDEFNGTTCA